jgi:hypothetical protein
MNDPKPNKWLRVDQADWPAISPEKYAGMLTQIAVGLLASGHFTHSYSGEEPRIKTTVAHHGYHEPCVLEDAVLMAGAILGECRLRAPEDTGEYQSP